jgi:hypothetical protein
VSFPGCTFSGGIGDSLTNGFAGNDENGGHGGNALQCAGSLVALDDCTLTGGRGGCGDSGGDGGDGLLVQTFGVFVSG